MENGNDRLFTVGYRKPPKANRFTKGQSGNPAGRPKGTLNLATVIQRTLEANVVIKVNGRLREFTMLEAAMLRLATKAADGDLRALHMVTELARKREERVQLEEPQKPVLEEADKQLIKNLIERFPTTSIGGNGDETDPERKTD